MELLQALVKDRAGGLAFRPRVEVSPDKSIGATVALMRSSRCGCALVVRENCLAGIFTERDVLTRVLARGVALAGPVSTVMTTDPVMVAPDDSVAEVIRRMYAGGHRHLPVVGSDRGIRGVVSVKGVIHYLVEHFPDAIYNLPPDPAQRQTAREGA